MKVNIILGWKCLTVNYKCKKFCGRGPRKAKYDFQRKLSFPGAMHIKLFFGAIYAFCNKLEGLSMLPALVWKAETLLLLGLCTVRCFTYVVTPALAWNIRLGCQMLAVKTL